MGERYEREIDELLYRIEGRRRRQSAWRRLSSRLHPWTSAVRIAFSAYVRRPPSEIFMIAAMVLVIVSFLLSMLDLHRWASYASLFSIALFVLGIALSVAGRRSPGFRRRWRGRELDYGHGPSVWVQLRDWWRRRRR